MAGIGTTIGRAMLFHEPGAQPVAYQGDGAWVTLGLWHECQGSVSCGGALSLVPCSLHGDHANNHFSQRNAVPRLCATGTASGVRHSVPRPLQVHVRQVRIGVRARIRADVDPAAPAEISTVRTVAAEECTDSVRAWERCSSRGAMDPPCAKATFVGHDIPAAERLPTVVRALFIS